jgi:hypothetical protein
MSTWEPDSWTFFDDKLKSCDIETSSSESSSDDEPIFTKTKTLRKTKYKKIEKEDLLPE